MKLRFVNGNTTEVKVEKETKKFINLYCPMNAVRYRVNKETGEVQDGTYHKTIKGMCVEY